MASYNYSYHLGNKHRITEPQELVDEKPTWPEYFISELIHFKKSFSFMIKWLLSKKNELLLFIFVPIGIWFPVAVHYSSFFTVNHASVFLWKIYFTLLLFYSMSCICLKGFIALPKAHQITLTGFAMLYHLFLFSFIGHSSQVELSNLVGYNFVASKKVVFTYQFLSYLHYSVIYFTFFAIISIVISFFLSKEKYIFITFFKSLYVGVLFTFLLVMGLSENKPMMIDKSELIAKLDFSPREFCNQKNVITLNDNIKETIVYIPLKAYGSRFHLINCAEIKSQLSNITFLIQSIKLPQYH